MKDKNMDILSAFSRVKKMSYRGFEQFMQNYGQASYEMGIEYGDANSATWFEDDLFNVMVSEGVDEETANRVIDILLKKGATCE